jgi:TolB protein
MSSRHWFWAIPVVVLLLAAAALPSRGNGQAAAPCTTTVLTNRAAIYAVSMQTRQATNLMPKGAPVNAMTPTWSPDRSQIAFAATTCPSCGPAIYKMRAGGGPVTKLGAGSDPSWSARGKLAFIRRNAQGEAEIQEQDQDGQGVQTMSGRAHEGLHPAWSPDGSKLAFAQEVEAEEKTEINVLDVATGSVRRVTHTPSHAGATMSALEPSWSPDGRRLAFAVLQPDFTYAIDVVNVDGTGLRTVVHGRGNAVEPAWSPDGTRLVFGSDRDSPLGFHGLYVINVNGSGLTKLTGGTWDDSHPSWSPDGTTIVFSRRPSQCVAGR